MANTTERGYGWRHQKIRAALLKAHIEGEPCNRCGQPMYSYQQLDAGHTVPLAIDPTSEADCLQHAVCNRGEGTAIAQQVAGTCPAHGAACGGVHSQDW